MFLKEIFPSRQKWIFFFKERPESELVFKKSWTLEKKSINFHQNFFLQNLIFPKKRFLRIFSARRNSILLLHCGHGGDATVVTRRWKAFIRRCTVVIWHSISALTYNLFSLKIFLLIWTSLEIRIWFWNLGTSKVPTQDKIDKSVLIKIIDHFKPSIYW